MFTQLATRTAEQLAPSSATNAELETVVNVLAQHDKAQQLTDIINANTSFSQILNTNPTATKSFLDVLVKAGQWQTVLDMTSHMLLHLRGDTTIDQHNYEYVSRTLEYERSLADFVQVWQRFQDMEALDRSPRKARHRRW